MLEHGPARSSASAARPSSAATSSPQRGRAAPPSLARAGRAGQLRPRFATAGTSAAILHAGAASRAARLGGRLDCVSLLRHARRLRRAQATACMCRSSNGASRLPPRPTGTVVHWRQLGRRRRRHLAADLVEALAQSVRCQSPRDAVATLDSAWHHRSASMRTSIARRVRAAPAPVSAPATAARSAQRVGARDDHATDAARRSAARSRCRSGSPASAGSTSSSTDG